MPRSSAWPRTAGTGTGICAQQPRDVDERQRRRSRSAPACSAARSTAPSGRRTRKYRRSDASPVSGTTRGDARREAAAFQIAVDALARIVRCPSVACQSSQSCTFGAPGSRRRCTQRSVQASISKSPIVCTSSAGRAARRPARSRSRCNARGPGMRAPSATTQSISVASAPIATSSHSAVRTTTAEAAISHVAAPARRRSPSTAASSKRGPQVVRRRADVLEGGVARRTPRRSGLVRQHARIQAVHGLRRRRRPAATRIRRGVARPARR